MPISLNCLLFCTSGDQELMSVASINESNNNGELSAPLLRQCNDLLSSRQWQQVAILQRLTPRETEVTKLLFQELTVREIAVYLGLKMRTVRQHMEKVHRKLSVTNRVGMVLRIIQTRDYLQRQQTTEVPTDAATEIERTADVSQSDSQHKPS